MFDVKSKEIVQFINCSLLRNHEIINDDLWVRYGKIVNPEKIFFEEKLKASKKINCQGALIAPGYIDVQINGGFGTDFSYDVDVIDKGLANVAKHILAHGVTSFCPTLVTSPSEIYKKVLPKIKKKPGGAEGAAVLGVHLEGPFINPDKRGAHNADEMKGFQNGFVSLLDAYGSLENATMITLAPEIPMAMEVIHMLVDKGITVSLGHSTADIKIGEEAARKGATLITHLFNAMLPFHHRDPGLVGLLTTNNAPRLYYGIIADGVHTHPAALRIAHRAHPDGVVLVTDAISALGLPEGTHHLGQLSIEVKQNKAFIAGTTTLCGSIASMDMCVRYFKEASSCSLVEALEAASLHPAQALGISRHKGTLDFEADADFILLGKELEVWSTWIAGECVYENKEKPLPQIKQVQ